MQICRATSIYETLPCLARFALIEENLDKTDVASALVGNKSGLLFRVDRCVREYLEGGSWLSGWGHTNHRWFYVETFDGIAPIALAWHLSRVEHEVAKAKKGGA